MFLAFVWIDSGLRFDGVFGFCIRFGLVFGLWPWFMLQVIVFEEG